jgi:cephalosporin-C deacetylase
MATKEDLESFITRVTRPDDFESFWKGLMEEVAQVPLEPRLVPDAMRSNDDVQVYQATYRSLGGLEIAAWYAVPAKGEGPFPAILNLPGYKGEPTLRRDWGARGIITLSVAVRGKLRSNSQFNPGYPGLLAYGVESRETYGYRGVISDCARGVDFLLSRPEVDSERIFACGSSQGGGLTLITSALRSEIKGGVSGYPFLCCFPESMEMLRSYPYDELSCYARAYPERAPQMLETLRYFDAVNFVGWIKCPMAVGIALEDEVCPPETSYAAYRGLGGEKELWLFPNSGHGNAHDYPAKETEWLLSNIQESLAQKVDG